MTATITANVEKGKISVRSPYEARALASRIPGGIWDKPAKLWKYPAQASTADTIFRTYTQSNFEIDCDRAFVELCARAQQQIAARDLKHAVDLAQIPGDYCACDTPLPGDDEKGENVYYCMTCAKPLDSWLHQKRAYHFAAEQDGALLAVGMGGGKSKLGVALLEGKDAKTILIVAPNSVVPVWPKEFGKHATQDFDVWAGEVLGRSGKPKKKPSIADRAEAVQSFLCVKQGRRVVVVNYEAAWRSPLAELLLSIEWDAVLLDESHRIKAPGSKQSMFCGRLRDSAKFRLALTGTPQPHSPLDIYAQARFIDPGVFGTNFSKFRNKYAVMVKKPFSPVPVVDGYQNEDELADNIAKFSFIITQEELDESLGLAAPTEYDRPVVLGAESRKVYGDVWNQFVVDFGDKGEVVADNALTRVLRVQQITSGHVGTIDDDDARDIVELGTEKADVLADILEDLPPNAPLVVFCRFSHDLKAVRRVAEAAGKRYGELSGKDKGGMKDDATMREDVDVLGVQIKAGGVGIDLTRAAYAVFYSIGYSLGDYLQARKRVHRPGQTRHVTMIHLVAQNTIDEVVYAALAERKQIVDAVMQAAQQA